MNLNSGILMFGNNWIILFFIFMSPGCAKDYNFYDNSSLDKCENNVEEIKINQLSSIYSFQGTLRIIAKENNYLYILEELKNEYLLIRINESTKEIQKYSIGDNKNKFNFKIKDEVVYYKYSDNFKNRLLSYNFKNNTNGIVFDIAKNGIAFSDYSYEIFGNSIFYVENADSVSLLRIYKYDIVSEKSSFRKFVEKNEVHFFNKFSLDIIDNDTLIYFFSNYLGNNFINRHSLKNNTYKQTNIGNCLYGSFNSPFNKDYNFYFTCSTSIFNYNKFTDELQIYYNEKISESTYPKTNGNLVAAEIRGRSPENRFGIYELNNPGNIRNFSSEHVNPNFGLWGYNIKNEIYNEYLIYLNQNKEQTVSKYFIINLNNYCTENIIVVENSDVHYFDEVSKSFYIISKNRTEIRAL